MEVKNLLFKWLNRRGKKNCLNWVKFLEMLKRFLLPKPQIRVSMFGFYVRIVEYEMSPPDEGWSRVYIWPKPNKKVKQESCRLLHRLCGIETVFMRTVSTKKGGCKKL
jgi:hypothetical protein